MTLSIKTRCNGTAKHWKRLPLPSLPDLTAIAPDLEISWRSRNLIFIMKFHFHQFFCPFLRPRHAVFAVSAVIIATESLLPAQTNWRQVSSGTTANLRSVTFLNGQFIACGDNAGSDAKQFTG